MQFVLLLALLSMVSCKKDSKVDEGDVAYLGGEIINPSNNTVLIYKGGYRGNSPLDTLLLDDNNRFFYKFTHLEPGFYTFHHGTDVQMVLMEPNDSLMVRLNTIDFDESLVYTGIGAKKNNYLIDLFLESEREDQKVLKYCQFKAEDFEKRLDSLKTLKLERLKEFNAKNTPSKLFETIAKANIDYNYYMTKEVYPFAYYSKSEMANLNSLPMDFYAYRKNLDYNNQTLEDYFPYYEFLKYHFRNLAFVEQCKQTNDSVFNYRSVDYNITKMKLIDSLVQNKKLKNNLLADTAFRFFNSGASVQENGLILKEFLKLSTDERLKEHSISYTNTLQKLEPGNLLPNVTVLDAKNKPYSINELIKKPTVIYFWSYTIKRHFKDSHLKIEELKTKYPEVNFISININNGDPKFWVSSLRQNGFNLSGEYRFADPDKAKETWALYPINKVVLTNKKGIIEDSNANMFSIQFEEKLLGLVSR